MEMSAPLVVSHAAANELGAARGVGSRAQCFAHAPTLRRLRLRLLPNRPGFGFGQLCQNMGARVHLLPLCLRLQTPLAGKPARFGRPQSLLLPRVHLRGAGLLGILDLSHAGLTPLVQCVQDLSLILI